MKKVFSCLLVVLMLASMLVMSVGAMWDEAGTYQDFGAIGNVERKSIRLDGMKEDVYDAATPIIIATPKTPDKVTDTYGVAYIVYDSEYIWVYVEVNDTALATSAPSRLESSFKEDCVEVLIDWENQGKVEANVTPYQSRLTHEGYISGRVGKGGTSLYGTAEDGAEHPVYFLDGFAQHRADGTGYDCEFRIAPPTDKFAIGDRIGLTILINDYDANGGNRIILNANSMNPIAGTDWNPQHMGSIAFDNFAPYTADTTIIYVAIAMVAALAVGAVALISLKKKAK